MKTFRFITIILAAGLAGAGLVEFGNAAVLASLPGNFLFGLAISLGLAGFGIYDYSRRYELQPATAPVLHPSLPCADASGRPGRSERTAA